MPKKQQFAIAIGLIAISVLGRIIPHPWNMTPVAASALFAGAYLGARWSLVVPLLSMLIGDAIIGFYNWEFLSVVYASMLAIGFASYLTKGKRGAGVFLTRPIGASVFFFLTTNAAVCFFGTMYPHTLPGLFASYISGLPFFGHDLLGNLLFTGVLFGGYEYAKKLAAKRARILAA